MKLFCTLMSVAAALCCTAVEVKITNLKNNTPVIDGNLNDPCWKNIPWQSGFTTLSQIRKPEPQKTRFKIAGGKYGFYFAFECTDTAVKSQVRHHDGTLWVDDCVEIFIVPEKNITFDMNVREYFQFILNASGSRYDQHVKGGVGSKKWNPPWNSAVKRTAAGFNAEVFIPYAVFPDATGNVWRLNIGRENPGVGIFSWMKLKEKFTDLDNYAYISGIPYEQKRFNARSDELQLVVRNQKNKLAAFLKGKAVCTPGTQTLVTASVHSAKGERKFYITRHFTASKDGEIKFDFPTPLKKSGRYEIRFRLYDNHGLIATSEVERDLTLAPMTLKMARPNRAHIVCSKDPEKTIRFRTEFAISAAQRKKSTIQLQVKDAKGKVMYTRTKTGLAAAEQFAIDTKKYPFGKYTMTLELRNGGKILGSIKTPLIVAEPTVTEVWLNKKRQVVINGKTVFPRGFMGAGAIHLLKDVRINVIHNYVLHHSFRKPDRLKKYLDDAHKQGLKVMFYPFNSRNPAFVSKSRITKAGYDAIRKNVMMVRNHPALLGWFTFDEPRNPVWMDELKKLRTFLTELDPTHLVFGNDNGVNGCIALADAADVIMLDVYPRPRKNSGNDRPILGIYNGTLLMDKVLPYNGIWNIPQTFNGDCFIKGESPFRAPTFIENRCHVFCAIAGGATGMLPYKIGVPTVKYFQKHSNSGIYESPEMKVGFLEGILPELEALEKVLLSDRLPDAVKSSSADIKTCTFRKDGKYYIIAINPMPKNVGKVTLTLPGKAVKYQVLGEKRNITAVNGKLTDSFSAKAVHVYTDDLQFKMPVDLAKVQQKIRSELKKAGK